MASSTCYRALYCDRPREVVVPHTREEMFKLPPKVLLFHEQNDGDDMRDRMIHRIMKKLQHDHHIEYTFDLRDIKSVQMTVVFINKSFIRNCSQFLSGIAKHARRSSMWCTSVWYENHDSRLFREMLNPHLNYQTCFEPRLENKEYKRLRKRLLRYNLSTNTKSLNVHYRDDRDGFEFIQMTNTVASMIAFHLNPLCRDFSVIDECLKTYTIDLSYHLHTEAVSNPRGHSLIAINTTQDDNRSQLNTTSQLLYTLVNHRSSRRFEFCIHLSKSQQQQQRRPRSLFNHFHDMFCVKYHPASKKELGVGIMMCRFVVVIDELESFLSEKEPDPAIMLANFVHKLGRGSLVITTCGKETTATILRRSTIEGMPTPVPSCTRSWPDTTQRPACYTILNSQLNQLVLKPDDASKSQNYDFLKDDGMDPRSDDQIGRYHTKKKTLASYGASQHIL